MPCAAIAFDRNTMPSMEMGTCRRLFSVGFGGVVPLKNTQQHNSAGNKILDCLNIITSATIAINTLIATKPISITTRTHK